MKATIVIDMEKPDFRGAFAMTSLADSLRALADSLDAGDAPSEVVLGSRVVGTLTITDEVDEGRCAHGEINAGQHCPHCIEGEQP